MFETPPSNQPPPDPSMGHEPNTFSIRGVLRTTAVLVTLVLVVVVLMWAFEKGMMLGGKTPEPLVPSESIQPPGAGLNADQPRELRALHDIERNQLGSYGWVDREHNIARIPIQRAMEWAAEDGLKAQLPAELPANESQPSGERSSAAAEQPPPGTEDPAPAAEQPPGTEQPAPASEQPASEQPASEQPASEHTSNTPETPNPMQAESDAQPNTTSDESNP